MDDSLGREVDLTVWSHPGNDVTGMAARSEKIVNAAEKVGFIKKWEIIMKANPWSLEHK